MSKITDEEFNALSNAKSAVEWNKVCDGIKASRMGMYPDDWWEKVMQSGLMDRVAAGWGGSSKIDIIEIRW